MKRTLTIIAMALMVSGAAVAQMDMNTHSYVEILPAVANTNSAGHTYTNAAIDIAPYKGGATLLISVGACIDAESSYTGTVTIYECATTGGTWVAVSGFTHTVTGAVAGSTEEIAVDLSARKKYIRGIFTATNSAGSASAVLAAP